MEVYMTVPNLCNPIASPHPAICMQGRCFPLIADIDIGNGMNSIAGAEWCQHWSIFSCYKVALFFICFDYVFL